MSSIGGARKSHFDGERWIGYRTYVKLVREGRAYEPCEIRCPSDVFEAFRSLSGCDRERLYAVHLDAQHCVCGVELVSQGGLSSSVVTPRELYKSAILANAAAVILVHNHPSGNVAPSADDRAITAQLLEAGRVLDIPVHDHVIVGDGKYMSFAEAGLL